MAPLNSRLNGAAEVSPERKRVPIDDARGAALFVLRRGFSIALFALSIDVIASGIPAGTVPVIGTWHFGTDLSRQAVIHYLITYSSLVPALIVTVTSLAIATVTPFGNPALFLLYRHEPSDWIPRIFGQWVSSRTNRFLLPMTLSIGLVLGLQAMALSYAVGLTRATAPALLFLAVIGTALAISSLTLVFSLIALRRAAAVVDYAHRIAVNTLAAVSRRRSWFDLTPWTARQWPLQGVASPYTAHYEDQHIVKMCVYTLTEAAIRSVEAKQRFQAREAVEALNDISVMAMQSDATLAPDWGFLYRTTRDRREMRHPGCSLAKRQHTYRPLWLEELLIESLESTLLVSSESHYQSVGTDASAALRRIATFLLGKLAVESVLPDAEADALLDRTIEVYESALDECIQFEEVVLFERLVRDLSDLLAALPTEPFLCPRTASELGDRMYKGAWQAFLRERVAFCDRFTNVLVANRGRPAWASAAIDNAQSRLLTDATNARNMAGQRTRSRRRSARTALPITSGSSSQSTKVIRPVGSDTSTMPAPAVSPDDRV